MRNRVTVLMAVVMLSSPWLFGTNCNGGKGKEEDSSLPVTDYVQDPCTCYYGWYGECDLGDLCIDGWDVAPYCERREPKIQDVEDGVEQGPACREKDFVFDPSIESEDPARRAGCDAACDAATSPNPCTAGSRPDVTVATGRWIDAWLAAGEDWGGIPAASLAAAQAGPVDEACHEMIAALTLGTIDVAVGGGEGVVIHPSHQHPTEAHELVRLADEPCVDTIVRSSFSALLAGLADRSAVGAQLDGIGAGCTARVRASCPMNSDPLDCLELRLGDAITGLTGVEAG